MGTLHAPPRALSRVPPAMPTAAAPARATSRSLPEQVGFASLLLFVAALPLSRSVAEGGALFALLLWLAHRILRRDGVCHHALWFTGAAFFLFSAASSIASLEPALSLPRMKTVALVMSAVLVAEMVDSRPRLVACLAAIATGTVVSLGIVAVDYARGIGVEVRGPARSTAAHAGLQDGDVIQRINGDAVRTPNELLSRLSSGTVRLDVARTELEHPFTLRVPTAAMQSLDPNGMRTVRPLRARGNLKHPPTYAFVLTLSSLLLLGVVLAGGELRQWRIALTSVTLLAAAGVFLTVSRAAVAALLLAAALALWLTSSTRRLRLGVVVAVSAALLLAPLWFSATRNMDWLATRDAGTNYRLLMWKDGARLALAHPLLGVGMDSARQRWQELGLDAYRRFGYHSHFHSTPLEIAAERGLPALLAWLAIVALAMRSAWRAFRAGVDHRLLRGSALGVLCCLLAYGLLSLVYSTVGDATMAMASWFVIGLAFAVGRLVTAPQKSMAGVRA